MEREHEEAMRIEFARYTQLGEDMQQPTATDADCDRITAQRREIGQRWADGPHAEHWGYLDDAYEDWRRSPEPMFRLVDNIVYNDGAGATELQYRSLQHSLHLAIRDSQTVRDAFHRHTNPDIEQQQQPARSRGVQRGR
ncbi:hypothetical protein ACRS6B_28130 [Nocardia asteroides]